MEMKLIIGHLQLIQTDKGTAGQPQSPHYHSLRDEQRPGILGVAMAIHILYPPFLHPSALLIYFPHKAICVVQT
jgi:hypothetical protein